jgi:hypothetical protein
MNPLVSPVITRLGEILGEKGIRCEWPGLNSHPLGIRALGADWRGTDPDTCNFDPRWIYGETSHIRARKWRNSTLDERPDMVWVLCRRHHNMYDNLMGQSPTNQKWASQQVVQNRGPWIMGQLEDAHGAPLSHSRGPTGISIPTGPR